jgi:hypothetical protein
MNRPDETHEIRSFDLAGVTRLRYGVRVGRRLHNAPVGRLAMLRDDVQEQRHGLRAWRDEIGDAEFRRAGRVGRRGDDRCM